MNVEPSQGSHLFNNMTSLRVGCLLVSYLCSGNFIDRERLDGHPAVEETEHVHHTRLEYPVKVMIDGRSGKGVMLKRSAGFDQTE